MDGNRRYARQLGLDPSLGYEAGAKKVKEFLQWCLDLGLRYVTLFAFSTENFNRKQTEVRRPMRILEDSFYELARNKSVHEHKVRIQAIGNRRRLTSNVCRAIETAENETKTYKNHLLTIAVAYGGRDEILSAMKKIAAMVSSDEISLSDITEKLMDRCTYSPGLPHMDLIIRTSGERRISNFMLWQSADAQLCFLDVFWPAIREIDLLRAIKAYQERIARRHSLYGLSTSAHTDPFICHHTKCPSLD